MTNHGHEKRSIQISLETSKLIRAHEEKWDEDPDVILKRVLKRVLQPRANSGPALAEDGKGLWHGQVFFRKGEWLRKIHKGGAVMLEIGDQCAKIGKNTYTNLSAAAKSVTGFGVNCWKFWTYLDPETGTWELIDRRRHSS